MRKVALALALFLALSVLSCKCAAEKASVTRIEATHNKISAKLLEYVNKDAALDAAAKNDWKLLVESDARNIDALKKALE